MTDKDERHPLVRKAHILMAEMASFRFNCEPKDLRCAQWLEQDLMTLADRLEAVAHGYNKEGGK